MNGVKAIYGLAIGLIFFQGIYVSAQDNSADDEKYKTAEAYNHRGVKYYKAKQYDNAIKYFSQVINLTPPNANSAKWKEMDSEAHASRGTAYYRLKQYEKAIPDYDYTIKVRPDYDAAYFCRGMMYLHLDQYDKAIDNFNSVIKLTPDYHDVYHSRGLAYYWLKQYDKAITDFTMAIKAKPYDDDIYFSRGLAYYCLKQYENAIADFNHAVTLNPDNDAAFYCRGITYNRLEKYGNELKGLSMMHEYYDYFKASQANWLESRLNNTAECYPKKNRIWQADSIFGYDPDDDEEVFQASEMHYDSGLKHYGAEEYSSAIKDFSRAIALIPPKAKTSRWIIRNSSAHFCRGLTYSDLKQYDKAIEDLNYSLKLVPNNDDTYFFLGSVYCKMKQYENAIKCYSKAIEFLEDQKLIEVQKDNNYPKRIDSYLAILEVCIVAGKPDKFNYWLEQMEKNIPDKELSPDNAIIKCYLTLVNRCIINTPRENLEKQLDELLPKGIEPEWSFDLINEWLNKPSNGLTPQQIKYIQDLTRKLENL